MPLHTESVKLDSRTTDPASPDEGRIWYRSDLEEIRAFIGEETELVVAGKVVPAVAMFQYDASAPSGSRFSLAGFPWTQLAGAGDALYVGMEEKQYAWLCEVSQAKSSEAMAVEIWNGSGWDAYDKCAISRSDDILRGPGFWEDVESQVVQADKFIEESTWATADNVLDEIPSTGSPLYWVRMRNTSGISTPAILDGVSVQRSSLEYNQESSTLQLWGRARKRRRDRLLMSLASSGEPDPSPVLDVTAFASTMPNPGSSSMYVYVYGTNYPSGGAQYKGRGNYSGGWTWVDGSETQTNQWTVLYFRNFSGVTWAIPAGSTITLTVDGSPLTIYLPAMNIPNGSFEYMYVDADGNTYDASSIYSPNFSMPLAQGPSGYVPISHMISEVAQGIQAKAVVYKDGLRSRASVFLALPSMIDVGSRVKIRIGLTPGVVGDYELAVEAKALEPGDPVGPAVPVDLAFSTVLSFAAGDLGKAQSSLLSTSYAKMVSLEGLSDMGCLAFSVSRDATPGNPTDTGGDLAAVEIVVDYVVHDEGKKT